MKMKNLKRIILATVLILMMPLIAMQFSEDVQWDVADFVIIAFLLIGTGLLYELATKRITNIRYRIAIGVVLFAALLLVWAELAVGVFGTPFAGS